MLLTPGEISEEMHQQWFARYESDPNDLVMIGEVDGEPVAHVSLYHMDLASRSADFGRLMVSERGRKFARLATWGAIRLAFRQFQLSELCLQVCAANGPAVRLYLDSGFQLAEWDGEVLTMTLRSRERWWENWDHPGDGEDAAGAVRAAWVNRRELAWRQTLARNTLPYLGTGSVCEVGCGSGLVLDALRQCEWRGIYVGYDTSYSMLATAMTEHPEGYFCFGDAYALPLQNNSVDTAICFEVLCHLPEIVAPVRELYRVARKHAVFTVWIADEGNIGTEAHGGQTFIHANRTVTEVVEDVVRACPPGTRCTYEPWSGSTYAFVIHKDCECD